MTLKMLTGGASLTVQSQGAADPRPGVVSAKRSRGCIVVGGWITRVCECVNPGRTCISSVLQYAFLKNCKSVFPEILY